jgi:hypothetical protein
MFAKTNNPTKRAFLRYNIELGLSMAAYLATMAVSRNLLYGPMRNGGRPWQVAIALMPLVPAIGGFAAIVRLIRGVDERLYRMFVDSLAVAGGITALLAVTYGLIEGDLFPPLSAWWTYSTFMLSWLVVSFFVRRRY